MNIKEFSDSYFELLTNEFAGINLTAINDPEEFYQKQILDSLRPLSHSKVFAEVLKQNGLLVDIGFGGGFPLLPLAWHSPGCSFLGLEAKDKKVQVVKKIAQHLDISNVKVYHQRYELVLWDRPSVVTFKAVSKIPELLKMFVSENPLTVVFYKGPNTHELENLKNIPKGWELLEETNFSLDSGEKRSLFIFQGENVPRRTKENLKLVRLSNLL